MLEASWFTLGWFFGSIATAGAIALVQYGRRDR